MTNRKSMFITIMIMVVVGTCMHFVLDLFPAGPVAMVLGHIFPVNETSWEHMKMIWYPFLTAGIIISIKTKNRGYFASFMVCAIIAMLMQLGAFSVYESFTGSSVLFLDIVIYYASMVFCALLAYDLADRKWAQKALPIWIVLAVAVTVAIIHLTYSHANGYVFLDNEGLSEHF